jgi:hypothetical protein
MVTMTDIERIRDNARDCAIIAVDEIMKSLEDYSDDVFMSASDSHGIPSAPIEFWQSVLAELNK